MLWGSTWPATTIARARTVELYVNRGDHHLDPAEEPEQEGKTVDEQAPTNWEEGNLPGNPSHA